MGPLTAGHSGLVRFNRDDKLGVGILARKACVSPALTVYTEILKGASCEDPRPHAWSMCAA